MGLSDLEWAEYGHIADDVAYCDRFGVVLSFSFSYKQQYG